jgi:hypothetical protein
MLALRPKFSRDGKSMTVRVPLSVHKRGGRKFVIAPDGTSITAALMPGAVDSTLVKAIARAFRWRDLLESGQYSTIREIARAEKINESYVGRILRLTLLSPDIVDATLRAPPPAELQLDTLMRPFPRDWPKQRIAFKLIT